MDKKQIRLYQEPVFSLFVLGNLRNMEVQHGELCEGGPALPVDIKGLIQVVHIIFNYSHILEL